MTNYNQNYNKYLTIFNGYLEEIYSLIIEVKYGNEDD